MSKSYKGIYKIKNKKKYIGKQDPIYRSSWESRVCYFLDHNPNVVRWGYEIISIPYTSIDNKIHTYILDFYAEMKTKDGKIEKYLLEVKPQKDGPIIDQNGNFVFPNKPKKPKINNRKSLKNYMYNMSMYMKNYKKWLAAQAYCKSNGLKFKIITENSIF